MRLAAKIPSGRFGTAACAAEGIMKTETDANKDRNRGKGDEEDEY